MGVQHLNFFTDLSSMGNPNHRHVWNTVQDQVHHVLLSSGERQDLAGRCLHGELGRVSPLSVPSHSIGQDDIGQDMPATRQCHSSGPMLASATMVSRTQDHGLQVPEIASPSISSDL